MTCSKPLLTLLQLSLLCVLCWVSDALCKDYDIYVSDAGHFSQPPWQILKFDQNGENPEVFINENLAWPHDIVFLEDTGSVLVSNFNSGRIDRFDADDGSFIDIFASGLAGPTRMKIGPDNLLYVLQAGGSGRVKRYQLDGTPVGEFTNLSLPRSLGLDWDVDGSLFVSSYDWRVVRQFNTAGVDQGSYVNTYLAGPTNIWFDRNGDLMVTDYDGGAIRRYDGLGNYQGDFVSNLSQPEGVDFLPNGNILVGDGGTSSVKMFTPEGIYIEDIINSGSGGLIQPNAIIVREKKTGANLQINAGLNDAWYNRATDGQGFLIVVYPVIKRMFVAWYTFDTERPPENVTANLGEPGHRWLTAQGPFDGDKASLTVFVTEGGVFDAALPPAITDLSGDGTMTIEFADCTEGLISYEITSLDISGEIPIERITPDNVALCESLSSQ